MSTDQRADIIDCQYQLRQLIEIVIGIGAWQIIAINDCFFFIKNNCNNWVYIRTIIVVFIQLSDLRGVSKLQNNKSHELSRREKEEVKTFLSLQL